MKYVDVIVFQDKSNILGILNFKYCNPDII